jgi:hypothetical protein
MVCRVVGVCLVLLALSWMFLAWRVWKIERRVFGGARSVRKRPVVLFDAERPN